MTAMMTRKRKGIPGQTQLRARMTMPAKGVARIALLACLCLFFAAQITARGQDASRPLSPPTRPPTSRPTQPGAAASSASAPTAPRAIQPRQTKAPAPAAPSSGASSVKLGGLDYIKLVDFAKKLGCSARWKKAGERLTVTKGPQRIEFTGDSRDFYVNGIRVFAGSAIRIHRGSLWISRIDADNILAPIVDPSLGRAAVVPLKVIAIDAGHGGIDKGKINERLKVYEKTFTLDTALRLKALLEKRGYKVVMTRLIDKKVELADRPEIAANAGADLFVSIHFNSVEAGAQSVSGAEVYRFTPRYQPPVSRSEANAEDKLANPGDANAFWSAVAAYNIHRALLADLKVPDRGFKHHKFAVLRLAKCPAVLIEAGFLSNDAEARKIATPEYRQKIAEAIADGIGAYAAAVAAAQK